MRSGEVVTDLNQLADEMGLDFMNELVIAKMTEKAAFSFDLKDHLLKLESLEKKLEMEFESSTLREHPERGPIDELLIKVRLSECE